MKTKKSKTIIKEQPQILTDYQQQQEMMENISGSQSSEISEKSFRISTLLTQIQNIIFQIFALLHSMLTMVAYSLLLFQTIYILNDKQPKYINLRHIALKWLICLGLQELKNGFIENRTLNSQIAVIIIDLFTIFAAFPSKILKSIHLKYFSHKENQRYQDSVADPNNYDATFSSRLIISLSVLTLTLAKHLIAFVHPGNRKPIEEALKNVNTVVLDKKCFWSIYQVKKDGEEEIFPPKDKNSLREFLLSGSQTFNSNPEYNEQGSPLKRSVMGNSANGGIIKAMAQKCSIHSLKPIKKVQVTYNCSTSELELLDMDFGKIQKFMLEELCVKDQQARLIEFKGIREGQKYSQDIIIAFKSSKDMYGFMKSIEDAERM